MTLNVFLFTDPPYLCNGTRLVVTGLMPNCVKAVIITGEGTGQDVLIPRIPFKPTDSSIPFRRLQLPLSVSFAFTQHKSQGQTLKTVGLYLKESSFAHGQFYVGVSRTGKSSGLHIFAPNGRTRNVVLQKALQKKWW